MSLLSITSFFHLSWPYLLFTLILLINVFLLSFIIFAYVDGKEIAEAKSRAKTKGTAYVHPPLTYWKRYKAWMQKLIKKQKQDDEDVEEYNDRYGRFQLIGGLVLLGLLTWGISQIPFSEISVPEWLSNLIGSLWFWIALGIVGLLIFFRKKIFSTISTGTGSKRNWLKSLVYIAIGIIAFPLLIAAAQWCWNNFHVGSSEPVTMEKTNTTSSPSSASRLYPELNTHGTNDMEKGSWRYFIKRYDEPGITFKHEGTDTVTYRFEMAEDRSRSWEVKVWKDSTGEPVEKRLTPDEPYGHAQIGKTFVCIKETSAPAGKSITVVAQEGVQ